MKVPEKTTIILYPDAGPLITLAYADALDLLFIPGWQLVLVDMIYAEVTRSQTPTSARIRRWAQAGFARALNSQQSPIADTPNQSRVAQSGPGQSGPAQSGPDQSGFAVIERSIKSFSTRIHTQYTQNLALAVDARRQKNNLGEFAIQEAMNECALQDLTQTSVFLFEDHKIARASFLLPSNARKVSTRAFLQFLEALGRIESGAAIERRAVSAGRAFSQIHFS